MHEEQTVVFQDVDRDRNRDKMAIGISERLAALTCYMHRCDDQGS